ncbi:MAG: Ig-like domain-containing protein [Candidatus Zixiibacteriota bacterium]
MGKLYFIILSLLFLAACSEDNQEDGPDFNDTLSPSIEIIYPKNGDTIYGDYTIEVEYSDDDMVDRVKFIVDRAVLGWSYDSPFSYEHTPGSEFNGSHELQALAYDRSDNASLSQTVYYSFYRDLTPQGNAIIRAKVLDYAGDGELDDDSPGDPYFIFSFIVENDTTDFYSIAFIDTASMEYPYNADFDIPDHATGFKFAFWVYDLDAGGSEWVDYTPDADSRAYLFTLTLDDLPFEQSYNGEDDGNPDEPDCRVRLELTKIVIEE